MAAIAVAAFAVTYRNDEPAAKAASVLTYSTDRPKETKPDGSYRWQGGPNDPKKIVIPRIEIDHYIQNVGVDQRSEITVPDNIHVAGWFVESARPGEKGLSIIDGHLNGPQQDGIFIGLEKLRPGDTFTVAFGDGSSRTFAVRAVRTVPLGEAASVLYSQDPKVTSQLNLVTCAGSYDQKSKLYDKRVIVSAERVENK